MEKEMEWKMGWIIYSVFLFYWWVLFRYLVKFIVLGISMLVDNGFMNWFIKILVMKLLNIDEIILIYI